MVENSLSVRSEVHLGSGEDQCILGEKSFKVRSSPGPAREAPHGICKRTRQRGKYNFDNYRFLTFHILQSHEAILGRSGSSKGKSHFHRSTLLAPQRGALRRGAYRDFHPTIPLSGTARNNAEITHHVLHFQKQAL